MTWNLSKKSFALAGFMFCVVFWGSLYAQRWFDHAYWLPPLSFTLAILLGIVGLCTSETLRSWENWLIRRLPVQGSFFVFAAFVCIVGGGLLVGLRWGLKYSKQHFPKVPIEVAQRPPDIPKPVPEPKPIAPPQAKPQPKPTKVTVNNSASGNVTNAPGGIVNNGGVVNNPTVINVPPPPVSNPLDPYDGKPDSKVADDALGMADKFNNSIKSCEEGMKRAQQQDIEANNPQHTMYHLFLSQERADIRSYSKDLRDLHASLIYRLGVAQREARFDDTLDRLLEIPKQYNLSDFSCMDLEDMGRYFTRLGYKLRVKAVQNHP